MWLIQVSVLKVYISKNWYHQNKVVWNNLTLGGFISFSMMKPKNVVENVNRVEIFITNNSMLRVGLYKIYILCLGLGFT